jgi:hypothetical protein
VHFSYKPVAKVGLVSKSEGRRTEIRKKAEFRTWKKGLFGINSTNVFGYLRRCGPLIQLSAFFRISTFGLRT